MVDNAPPTGGARQLSAAESLHFSSSEERMSSPTKMTEVPPSLLSVGADCIKVVVDTSVSEMAMLQHLYGTMDWYGHTITVKVITGATLIVLYLYVSGTSLINLEAYDPVVVDHAIAAIALSGPVGYALLLNMYYSDVETPVGLTLLTLRISCCCIVGAAMTVFLAECFSRRLVFSLVLMGYGVWGIGYAWSVPLWRWYTYDVRRHGLVAFLPAGLQDTLLRMTLLEWLTDTSFADKLRDYFPFFLPLNNVEQQRVVHSLPCDTQTMMHTPGLVHLLPSALQDVLLPPTAGDSIDVVTTSSSRGATAGDDKSTTTTAQGTAMVGFDFHKLERSGAATSSTNVLTEILHDKISKYEVA
ncbi:hypothetical protein, variant 2 [Aphanomyces astaci]|uniref:Uncharacterized protein n=1 Tax=Aphanomyces astaci TaxID=112090 RepID=W4GKU6_APHAT|nr:hypothetical protein, variant 1 [Aphanomyces astaci]XP_009831365.1 hypothetical protein, variant 2 [Aphanomyces astaci]ETV79523.1 hypothetical protein, variant 1 [Aphanomyces astaci]ETV79524.1 hypothetical protein, variant 2 [Aphanomyces astaci]|eukprot:XP_009831364.1 hypothetical protein, variant 1 [Aphanomyces astaci]